MAWTTPKTWTSATVLTAAELNEQVRDNLSYLKAGLDGLVFKGCSVSRVAATSISDASYQTITWTAELYDHGDLWSSGTTVTVPAGLIPSGYTEVAVLVIARTKFAANGTGIRQLVVNVDGSAYSGPTLTAISGEVTEVETTFVLTVDAGTTFTVDLYQNSGGSLNASSTFLSLTRLFPVA